MVRHYADSALAQRFQAAPDRDSPVLVVGETCKILAVCGDFTRKTDKARQLRFVVARNCL